MKPNLTVILIILFLAGCKTSHPTLEDESFYNLINVHFPNPGTEVRIYKKTINQGQLDIKSRISFENLNHNVTATGGRIIFEEILTESDLDFLKGQIAGLQKRKINPQHLNFSVRLVSKKDAPGTWHFSEPLFTPDGEYAFIFRWKGSGGESFSVFRKEGPHWKFLCEVVLSLV